MKNKIKVIALLGLLALTTARETRAISWKLFGAIVGIGIAAATVVCSGQRRSQRVDRGIVANSDEARIRRNEAAAEEAPADALVGVAPVGAAAEEAPVVPPAIPVLNGERVEQIQTELFELQQEVASGSTLLIYCINKNLLEHVQVLLSSESVNPNQKDSNGWTPLMHAANANNIPAINLLLHHGAEIDNINLTERTEMLSTHGTFIAATPLMLACVEGHLDSVRFLHKRGACLTVQDDGGLNPLMWATMAGHSHVVAYLLQQPEILEIINNTKRTGATALMLAATNGRPDCARLLCENGAEIGISLTNPRAGEPTNALMIAVSKIDSIGKAARETAQVIQTFSGE